MHLYVDAPISSIPLVNMYFRSPSHAKGLFVQIVHLQFYQVEPIRISFDLLKVIKISY